MMKAHWSKHITRVLQWYHGRSGNLAKTRIIELAYHNAIPRPAPTEGQKNKLSDVLSFIKPLPRPVNAFNITWSELLEPNTMAARVNAQFGLGLVLPNQPVLAFNFIGLHPMSEAPDTPDALAAIEALHARILDMRSASIISDAPQGSQ